MRLCFIADANSIHTRRWIAPFVERGDTVYLLSYTPIRQRLAGVESVDLTRFTDVRKIRWAYSGWWIRRFVRQVEPDILHAHQIQAAGWLGAMANRRPFVVSAWGSDLLIEPHRSALRRLLVKLVLRQCDRLTVPSRLMYDAATSLGFPNQRLHLIPWGIDTDIFRSMPDDRMATRIQLGIASNAKVVFCPRAVGRLYNLDILMEAIGAALASIGGLRLVLLRFNPDPDYLAELETMIAAYDLEEVVLWLPHQESASDMARLYRMADVVVSIPSSEGYGFTVYEAMAAGCPTVISDLPVFQEELVNGLHTIKVPVRDVAQTSCALASLLNNRDMRQELRRNALSVCEEKSVEIRIQQASALYAELVGQAQNGCDI